VAVVRELVIGQSIEVVKLPYIGVSSREADRPETIVRTVSSLLPGF